MNPQQALRRLASLCVRREYCAADMYAKMKLWGISKTEQTKIIDYLMREKYIDEARYCRAFAREKLRFSRWGARKIRLSLAAKHIDAETIDAAIDELDDGEYTSILRDLLARKAQTITAKSTYERDQRLLAFAAGRGFSPDEARKCLAEI
ncbi:MAG: RecX family transcriptional regulator [Prevotella sp.]|nr:RecX family transcriptional regulator [Prevotella sp.]